MNLCKNGQYFNNGVTERLICKKDNKDCTYLRYCNEDRCIKMLPTYIQCLNYIDKTEVT